MKHQKIINLLDNADSQPSKFRTNYFEVSYDALVAYNANSQMKLRSQC